MHIYIGAFAQFFQAPSYWNFDHDAYVERNAYVFYVDRLTLKTYKGPVNQAQSIIDKFGGINRLARALGHPSASTVQGWKERGFIPPRQHQAVWEAARTLGIDVDLKEFAAVDPDETKGSASEAAAGAASENTPGAH